ncbi:DUF3662 domain-containing protein [Mycobacterium avium subsp. paratuberculosis]|nr:DUF3662 domain-containing protein [Mycobacterium avium subsp. paratuberculosis]
MSSQRGLVARIERKLEATVDNAFARVFGGPIVPQEVEALLCREARDGVQKLHGNRLLAPNEYIITLGMHDFEKVSADPDLTSSAFARYLADYIHEQGWQTYGEVVVRFEQSSSLRTGQYRACGAVNPDVQPRPTVDDPVRPQSNNAFGEERGVAPMTDNSSYRGAQGPGRPGDEYYDERYGRPQDDARGGSEPQGAPDQRGGYPPEQAGYPEQGGYPPPQSYQEHGGYPDQRGGYPEPGQGGYPPQQHGYPDQRGYPEPAQGGYPQSYEQRPPAPPGYSGQGYDQGYPQGGGYGRQDYGSAEYTQYAEHAQGATYAPPGGGYPEAPGSEYEYGQPADYGQQPEYAQPAEYGQPADYGQQAGGYGGYGQGGYGSTGTTVTLQLDDGSGRTYQLREGSNIIGRGQDAQFRLPDTGVSRRHLEIRWDGQVALLSDLNSTNGTTVNNAPVQEWQLADGDVIRLGHSEIIVRIH